MFNNSKITQFNIKINLNKNKIYKIIQMNQLLKQFKFNKQIKV